MYKRSTLTASMLALAIGAALGVAGARHQPSGFVQVANAKVPTAKRAVGTRHKVIAYYFHGNFRCTSCRTIEAWTAKTIRADFAKDIQAGRLEWRVVNVEQAGNEHFMKDYKLFTKSVVLSDVHGGKQVRWKNLDKVWELLRDETAFRKYIGAEVRGYVDKA